MRDIKVFAGERFTPEQKDYDRASSCTSHARAQAQVNAIKDLDKLFRRAIAFMTTGTYGRDLNMWTTRASELGASQEDIDRLKDIIIESLVQGNPIEPASVLVNVVEVSSETRQVDLEPEQVNLEPEPISQEEGLKLIKEALYEPIEIDPSFERIDFRGYYSEILDGSISDGKLRGNYFLLNEEDHESAFLEGEIEPSEVKTLVFENQNNDAKSKIDYIFEGVNEQDLSTLEEGLSEVKGQMKALDWANEISTEIERRLERVGIHTDFVYYGISYPTFYIGYDTNCGVLLVSMPMGVLNSKISNIKIKEGKYISELGSGYSATLVKDSSSFKDSLEEEYDGYLDFDLIVK